jgi:hypothetical protein
MGLMKPGHAAALALVGWYLMIATGSTRDRDPHVPAARSVKAMSIPVSFDTAEECRNFQGALLEHIKNLHGPTNDFPTNEARYEALFGKSIATDDPRLKEK